MMPAAGVPSAAQAHDRHAAAKGEAVLPKARVREDAGDNFSMSSVVAGMVMA